MLGIGTLGIGWGFVWFSFGGGVAPAPIGPVQVSGGTEVAVCGWPTVVRLSSGCSATLVHPQVVLYAAHCGAGATSISVGEISADGTQYATDGCWQSPAWAGGPGGTDFAVCRLAEPVLDVPIVPIMMGCEQQLLGPGVEVTSVGFGVAPDGPNGIKRAVSYPIVGVDWDDNEVGAGGGDDDGTLCGGDSGGGTFVQGLDGSWRMMGVNSAVSGTPCVSGASILAIASAAVPWVEAQTGIDVSPCYDADGAWAPDDRCTLVPFDPATGGGAWPTCETGTLSGPLSTCGVPFEGDDLVAPTIAIAEPADGQVIPLDGELTASVAVTLEVDDARGFGVAQTWLRIDGRDVPGTSDDWIPFEVPGLAFPEGSYTLQAVAVDWAGNEAVSADVTVTIGEPPSGAESTDDAAADESDDGQGESSSGGVEGDGTSADTDDALGDETMAEDSGDGTTEPASDGGGDSACTCTSGSRGGSWMFGWLVLVSLARRRTS